MKITKKQIISFKEAGLAEEQKLLFDTLCYFDLFCQKNNIKFFLGFGTLLGAYRHQGFIPWDDDVDVFMTRSDYNLLLKSKDLLEEPYELIDYRFDKRIEVPYGRLLNKKMFYLKENNVFKKKNNHFVYIDIFILDFAKDSNDCTRYYKKERFDIFLISYKPNYYQPNLKSRILKPLLRLLLLPFSLNKCVKRIDHSIKKVFNYEMADNVIISGSINAQRKKRLYPAKCYFGGKKMMFNGRLFDCPSNPEIILKKDYGEDYMTPTPPDNREPKKYFYWNELYEK